MSEPSDVKPTPTPWEICSDHPEGILEILDRDGEQVAWVTGTSDVSNAAFIIEAVNSHAALLAVARAASGFLRADHHDHFAARLSDSEMDALEQIKSALTALKESGVELE
jgi:hypothetical protein